MPESTWPAERHTVAKHRILEEYLKAWFPILSRYSRKIVYLDGFAGPGIYTNGEEGSPIIAIRTALEHNRKDKWNDIIFLFIEKNKNHVEMLKKTLTEKFPHLPNNFQCKIEQSEFEETMKPLLKQLEADGKNLAPTFAFLDPFGYAGFTMDLISKLLHYEKCEIMITFMSAFVARFLDPKHENTMDKLYGTQDWRPAREKQGQERHKFLLDLYVTQLKQKNDVKFVSTFRMHDKNNRVIYDLIFATKHWKGMLLMKTAMWKIIENGTYRFSDKMAAGQTHLLSADDYTNICAQHIQTKFEGLTVNVESVRDFVLIELPYILYKPALRHLESNQKITNVQNRKMRMTHPDNCIITFS